MTEFPLITTFLSILLITSSIFTTNLGEKFFNPNAENHLADYENSLGFIPARPKIYSLITYTFIHIDIFHLFNNLIFLIITGLILEKKSEKFHLFQFTFHPAV